MILFFFFFFSSYVASARIHDSELSERLERCLARYHAAERLMQADSAADALRDAIFITRQMGDTARTIELELSRSTMLSYAGKYDEALALLLRVHEHNNGRDAEIDARVCMHVGTIHFFQQNWEQALASYERSLDLAQKIGNLQGVSIAENNIAAIYQKLERPQQALDHFHRCLDLQRTLGDSATICNTLFNIGTCQESVSQPADAMRYYRQALAIAQTIGDSEIEALTLLNIGKLLALDSNAQDGLDTIGVGLALAREASLRQVLREGMSTQQSVLEDLGRYKESLEVIKHLMVMSDSAFSHESRQMAAEFQVKYETNEKEKQIAIGRETLRRTRITLLGIVVVLVLAILIVLLLIRMAQHTRRRNTELEASNRTKSILFSVISHDLRSPATAQKNALKMLANTPGLPDDLVREQLTLLARSSVAQVELLENLLGWARMELGHMQPQAVRVDLRLLASEVVTPFEMAAKAKQIKFEQCLSEGSMILADRNLTSIVLRNLISNAIKFSHPGGTIRLSSRIIGRFVWIDVTDSGVGIPYEKLSTLFNIESRASTLGTCGEIGSGFGLGMCAQMARKNGGDIVAQSDGKHGSTFSFSVIKA